MKEKALKLADELIEANKHCIYMEDLPSAVTDTMLHAEAMIRKLVAELDKQDKTIQEGIKEFGKIQDQQLKDKFDKQGEPVAELLVNDGEPWGCRYNDEITLHGIDGWIPLYTTPQTKPLSGEEILDVCITGGIYDCINDPYIQKDGKYSLDIDLIKFAREIEKRLGIK